MLHCKTAFHTNHWTLEWDSLVPTSVYIVLDLLISEPPSREDAGGFSREYVLRILNVS